MFSYTIKDNSFAKGNNIYPAYEAYVDMEDLFFFNVFYYVDETLNVLDIDNIESIDNITEKLINVLKKLNFKKDEILKSGYYINFKNKLSMEEFESFMDILLKCLEESVK